MLSLQETQEVFNALIPDLNNMIFDYLNSGLFPDWCGIGDLTRNPSLLKVPPAEEPNIYQQLFSFFT